MKEQNETETEQQSNPVGRPLKFETVDELDMAIDAYLGECAPHIAKRKEKRTREDGKIYWQEVEYMTEQKPVTLSGAAVALNTTRVTLLSYKQRDEFLYSIERLLAECEAYAESQLFEGNSNGAKFALTNNYASWSDKRELDHTSKGNEIGAFNALTADELRKLAQG